MAKTVRELQAEYDRLTEQNRQAYDELKGVGTADDTWQSEYYRLTKKLATASAADREKIQSKLDELKPKFDAAQAKYKKTQEAKNAALRELRNAQTSEKTSKEESAKEKSAKSAYDKAMAGLKMAEAEYTGYDGQNKYKDAFLKAKAARDSYVQAGGTAPELTPIAGADVTSTTTGETKDASAGKGGTEDPTAGITTSTAAIKFLTDPLNKEALIEAQKSLTKFGYKGNTKGEPDPTFVSFMQKAGQEYASLPEPWRGGSLLNYLKNPLLPSSTGTGAGGTKIKSYTVQFDKTQAQAAINNVFQNLLGRDVTTDELKVISEQLIDAQKKNPTKYKITTDAAGDVRNSTQTGGLDVSQFITNLIKSGASGKIPTLKDEYTKIKLQDPTITKLEANKKLYETALAKAGPDLMAKQKVKETTAYGRGLKELKTQISDYIVNQGGTNTPDDISKFAQDLYDRGYDLSSEVGLSELQNFIKYTPGKTGAYTGKAGTVVQDLARTAMANGLDLQKTFGGKLQGWLTDINKGEPIDNIKQQIREIAKIGMPDNVKKLIDNGLNLEDIYSPYKSTMANVLEISPDSINMSDPTLRAAITAQGEVPLYDFERALRKDNRWQYTNQARSEVSSAAQRVLQDFGFMG